FFFSSRRRHARLVSDWSSDVCSSDLCHNYHEANDKRLPPGVGKFGCCWGTWLVAILPYIEQGNMGNLYQNFGGNDATGARYAARSEERRVGKERRARGGRCH